MMPESDNHDETVYDESGLPLLEATLVEEEPETPVYEAVRASDTPQVKIEHHVETERRIWKYGLVLCMLAVIGLVAYFILEYASPESLPDLNTCVPIDCKVSSWESWTPCSEKCDGKRNRTRAVVMNSDCGGEPCPHLYEEEDCNIDCCLDCEVTLWSSWSACSAECGGKTSRNRTIVLENNHCGKPCPPLEETKDCNTEGCCIDCQLSEWSSFGLCSEGCGGGNRTRTRTIVKVPNQCGEPCSDLEEVQECNTQPCGEYVVWLIPFYPYVSPKSLTHYFR